MPNPPPDPARPRAGSHSPRSSSRAAILAAAETLLLAHGPDRLTIRRLSDECGFSAPTIYHHFGDKRGLVTALLEEHYHVLLQELRSVSDSGDAAAFTRELSTAFVRFGLENPEHYRLLTTVRASSEPVPSAEAARQIVHQALERLSAEGRLAAPDVDSAFETIWAFLHGIITLRITRTDYAWSRAMLETAMTTIERGLLCVRA